MSVDPSFAAWLKQDALFAVSVAAGASAAWGDKAITSTVVSPLVALADAQDIADAQADFMAGPLVQDKAVVPGLRSDLIGKCITLKGDRLGYDGAGEPVFVIGAAEKEGGNSTTLTFLRRGL